MDRIQTGRRIKTLWALGLLGVAYGSLLIWQCMPTGADQADGVIAVLLGLYICSHPAANLVDLLFFGRWTQCHFSSRGSTGFWLALNTLVLLVGWFVIFVGTTRLVGRAD